MATAIRTRSSGTRPSGSRPSREAGSVLGAQAANGSASVSADNQRARADEAGDGTPGDDPLPATDTTETCRPTAASASVRGGQSRQASGICRVCSASVASTQSRWDSTTAGTSRFAKRAGTVTTSPRPGSTRSVSRFARGETRKV